MFLVQEVKTSISYLQEVFKVDISNINDDKIKSRKDDMSKHLQQLDELPKKMQDLLECANSVTEDQIEDIVGSYNHIKKLKDVCQQTISQMKNLKIRVIQWIKIEDQPRQIFTVRFKVRCVHFPEWIHQDLQANITKKNDIRCFEK